MMMTTTMMNTTISMAPLHSTTSHVRDMPSRNSVFESGLEQVQGGCISYGCWNVVPVPQSVRKQKRRETGKIFTSLNCFFTQASIHNNIHRTSSIIDTV